MGCPWPAPRPRTERRIPPGKKAAAIGANSGCLFNSDEVTGNPDPSAPVPPLGSPAEIPIGRDADLTISQGG